MEKNKVRVLINGAAYTLVTHEQPEYVQRVAIAVDKRIREIKNENPELTNTMLAMLTAINLSDEYIKLEDSTDNMRKQIAEYSKNEAKLSAALDECTQRAKALENEVQDLKLELARCGAQKNNGYYNKHK